MAIAAYYGSVHAKVIPPARLVRRLLDYRSGPENQFNEPDMFTNQLDHWSETRLQFLNERMSAPARSVRFNVEDQEASIEEATHPLESQSQSRQSSAETIWEHVRNYLKNRLDPHNFATWIEPIGAVNFNNSVLLLSTPAGNMQHITDKFGDLIEDAIRGRAEDVKFISFGEPAAQRATALA